MTKHTYTVKYAKMSVHQLSFVADHYRHARQIMDDFFKHEFSDALQVQSVEDSDDDPTTYLLINLWKEPDDYCPTGFKDYVKWKENIPFYSKYKEPADD
tara:strand:- start:752 stop:1048 length:297 start_codon:yes stop_codon:yes gene_type:complete